MPVLSLNILLWNIYIFIFFHLFVNKPPILINYAWMQPVYVVYVLVVFMNCFEEEIVIVHWNVLCRKSAVIIM